MTNEVASEAPVEPCYLLNQRLWKNEELVCMFLCSRLAIRVLTLLQLTRLEWMWGMQYDSLELDIEANRIHRMLYRYMGFNHH